VLALQANKHADEKRDSETQQQFWLLHVLPLLNKPS
jgi:hypothetical protein